MALYSHFTNKSNKLDDLFPSSQKRKKKSIEQVRHQTASLTTVTSDR